MVRNFVLLILLVFFASCADNKERSLEKVDKGIDMMYQMKKEKAKAYFEEAIKLDPGNAEAYYHLANYYTDRQEYKKAIELFDKALKINPQFANAWYGRGMAKFYLGDKKGACADWKKAAENGRQNLEDKLRHCP